MMVDERNDEEGQVGIGGGGQQQQQPQQQQQQRTETTSLSRRMMRVLFGMMGLAILLPFVTLLSCTDFYKQLHSDKNNISGKLTAFNISAVLLTTILLLAGDDNENDNNNLTINHGKQTGRRSSGWKGMMSATARIYFGFVAMLICTITFTLVRYPSMPLLTTMAVLSGVSDAISQSGILLLANHYGDNAPTYNASVQVGVAVSGVSISLLRLGTRGLFPTNTLQGLAMGCSLLYGLVSLIMVACIVAVSILTFHRSSSAAASSSSLLSDKQEEGTNRSDHDHDHDAVVRVENRVPSGKSSSSSSNNNNGTSQPFEIASSSNASKWWCFVDDRWARYFIVLRYTWKQVVSMLLDFTVTLILYPGVIASIHPSSSSSALSFGGWLTVVLLAMYNIGDFLGRMTVAMDRFTRFLLLHEDIQYDMAADPLQPQQSQQVLNKPIFHNYNRVIWTLTWIRFVFIPCIVLCICPSFSSPMISNDVVRAMIVLLVGYTNGIIVTANFAVTPHIITTNIQYAGNNIHYHHYHYYQDAAQLLNMFSLFIGLTVGSYAGLGLDAILTNLVPQ